jgi:cell filamentation protein
MTPIPNDPYCYPGTDVLINFADIHEKEALDRFEAQIASASIAHLSTDPVKGQFDARRLQETHRRIFGRVYQWAGKFRTGIGMMTKNRSGFVVAYGPSENVPAALSTTFTALKGENCMLGLNPEAMAQRPAYYYSELDAIHPFREGNSRTLRAFTADLAHAAGYRLEWAKTAEQRQRLYHARDVAVMRGETAELAQIFSLCLSKP